MRAALLIAAKDLRQRLRDRSALLIAVVVPLALASIFGLTLGEVASEELTFRYAVDDRDGSEVAVHFTDDLLGELEREGLVELVTDGSEDATFVIPAGFGKAVEAGRPAELQVVGDPGESIAVLVARSLAESYAGELTSVRVAVAAALGAGSGVPPQELAGRAAAIERPLAVDDVSTSTRRLDSVTFYAAGMAVFFLFFTVQFGVSSLLDERREGTLARLVAAPVPRASILAGKVGTSLVLGLVSMAVLVAATSLLLGADWGNLLGVAILVAAGVVAATAVTALIATLARTPDQAGSWGAIVALVLGMLGGSFFPVAQAGGLLEAVSLLTPHAWFLDGLGELAGGAGAGAILPATGAILAFAAVTGALALLRLGRLVAP